MVEYYGWLKVSDNAYESDPPKKRKLVKKIEMKMKEIWSDRRILEGRWVNGQFILCTAGCKNHMAKDANDIVALFKWIAQLTVGSYGLLYVYDDENQNGKDNEFQIFKVAKGKITLEKDSLLSPCSIKIHDEENANQF